MHTLLVDDRSTPPYISPEKPFDHAIYDWSKSGTQILPCNWSIWILDQIGPKEISNNYGLSIG